MPGTGILYQVLIVLTGVLDVLMLRVLAPTYTYRFFLFEV